jgi:hypothetical protein
MPDPRKEEPASSRALEPQSTLTWGMPIGKILLRIKGAFLFFTIGSAADIYSTWRSWTTLKPRQGHEANLIVVVFVRWLGLPAGLVGCKIVAAVVVLASSVTLARTFPRKVPGSWDS